MSNHQNSLFTLEISLSQRPHPQLEKPFKLRNKNHPPKKMVKGQKKKTKKRIVVEAMAYDDDRIINLGDRVNAMAYDDDRAIELQYDTGSDRYVPAMDYHSPVSFAPDLEAETEAFEVESFEFDEDEDDYGAKALEFHQDGEDQEDEDEDLAAEALAFSDEAINPEVLPPPESDTSEALSQDEFMAELQTILKGEKVDDGASQSGTQGDRQESAALSTSPATPPQQTQTQTSQAEEISPATDPHYVFEKMAEQNTEPLANANSFFDRIEESMAYANSYDLGTLALEKTIDKFERFVDEQEEQKNNSSSISKAKSLSQPLALNDEEIEADLAFMNEKSESKTQKNSENEPVEEL